MQRHELYGGDVLLEFDDAKHVYKVDGNKIVSVTGVTGIIDKSGPLMWWAVSQCVQYIQDNSITFAGLDEVTAKQFWHDAQRAHLRASKQATDIGTLAHQWIEDYLSGLRPEPPQNEKLASTVASWLDWAYSVDIQPVETEFKVYSREHEYAGTCDFDGFINGERAIVDWKTGKAVYPEHRLQTAAYQAAREEELHETYDCRWVVVLPKDGGNVTAERLDAERYEKDLTGFLGALELYKAVKSK